MQSTKKGPLTKREESGAQAGIAVLTSTVAEDAASLATVGPAPSGAQQPQVDKAACAVPLYPCHCHHTFPRLTLKGATVSPLILAKFILRKCFLN